MTLALFMMYKAQAQTQLGQVRHELAATRTSLAKAQARDDSRYTKMVGSVSNIGNALAPYTSICSTDLQGQAGPCSVLVRMLGREALIDDHPFVRRLSSQTS